jgi:hypothetical protein
LRPFVNHGGLPVCVIINIGIAPMAGGEDHKLNVTAFLQYLIRTCKIVDNGAYINRLPMPPRLDHIQTIYVNIFQILCT